MKIGIDLDGVVFDSEKLYRVYTELYDMIELGKNSKKDNRELKFQDRFDWTDEEKNNFLDEYQPEIISQANYMPGAKMILKKLKEEGNDLYIITARGIHNEQIIEITKNIFKETGMDIFTKCYWSILDKAKVCKDENIDIMIDDSKYNCESIANAGIKTIYMKDAPSYDIIDNPNVVTLYNWGEVYRYLHEMN